MLFSMEKNAHLALPLSVLPHRFGIIIIIYNFTNKVHFANIFFSAVAYKKTYESFFYFILYSENQCISKLDKTGIFIDMKFH